MSTFEVLIGVIHESAETHVASTRVPQRVVKNGRYLYGEGWARERLAKEKIMRGWDGFGEKRFYPAACLFFPWGGVKRVHR